MGAETKALILCLILTHIFALEKIYPEGSIVRNEHDNITLWCTSRHPATLLSFYQAGNEFSKESRTIFNETTIELNLVDVRPMEISVTCKYNATQGVDMKRVIVGTYPKRPNDFHCLSYDFKYFECQFTKPENFVTVNYSVNYTVAVNSYNCPIQVEGKKIICNLTMDNGSYRQVHDDYKFYVRAENKLGERVFEYNIKHFENVIPGRPVLHVINIGPHSALMEWDVGRTLYKETGLVFEINIVSEYNRNKWEMLDTSRIKYTPDTKYSYELRDLNPYTWYEVQLRLKVANAIDKPEMWSQINDTFQTNSTKPDAPPSVDVGSFKPQSLYNTSAIEFVIYWRGVPEFKRNARNLHYVIKDTKKNNKIVNIQPVETPTLYSAKFVQDEKADYELTIYTANEEGISNVGTVITVPRREYPLPQLTKIYKNKTYILKWNEPKKLDYLSVKDYTIYSCISDSQTSDQCESDFDFIHVPRNERNFTYTKTINKTVNFAIAANYNNGGSSGMVWAMCPVSASSDFGTIKPKGLPQNGTTIRLDWSLECYYKSIVEGFRLSYCPIAINNASCKEPIKTSNISGSLHEYYLTNLKPYTTYGIWMSMYSAKKQGPESNTPLEITTLEAAPSPPRRLTVLNKTDSSIGLQWEQPEFHNGKLILYKIYYNNEKENITAKNESIITLNLKNLSSYKDYKIYVTASTTSESNPSNDISVRTSIGTPSPTDQPNVMDYKDMSMTVISWKPPQVPSGPIDFYELKVSVFEKGQIVYRKISRINDTKCTLSISQDKICRDSSEKVEFAVRAVNVISKNNLYSDNSFEEYYPNRMVENQFQCKEENNQLLGWNREIENNPRFLRGVWSIPVTQLCSYSTNGSQTMVIFASIVLFGLLAACMFFLSKKYRKMKDIGITFPDGLTDLDQDCGPKGCDNVISRDDVTHSEESLKNENHKLLDNNRMDSGYMNGLDCTDKTVTGEYDDSSVDVIQGDEDNSSSRHAESVEMSDMSESLTNSSVDSPNINKRENEISTPIVQMTQRPLRPIIINGYVQHDSFPQFIEPAIPYKSLDTGENTIIPIVFNAADNEISKHKDPNGINTGTQENICGYVTHKQLSEFGHRQQ